MTTADFLRGRAIQPSHQRIRIWEELAATKAHPSADAIHRKLAPEIPTLSRTTVFSTLELFVTRGIAQKLATSGCDFRFDADISVHAHFGCRSCGAVSDVPAEAPTRLPKLPDGYVAERLQVLVQGLCPSCAGGDSGGASDGVGTVIQAGD